jgi:cytochrome c-type biogenesis protein CcmF
VAALITGRVSDFWITTTRRWTIVAWYFLSLGLLIGGWWSYHVLGWGGYWAWDPVENAAFMPWLTGTALLHSVMIQERRRMLRLWNIALVILTFSLTLFGTFLTRSGVIASVHAFSQSSIGIYFLSFLALVVLSGLGLIASRWDALGAQGELDSVVSRESAFLLNNVLLVAAAFTVFFGTVFPLLSEAVRDVKVSVGAPFFNQVNVPLFLSLIFLMGVGPLIAWRRASLENLQRNFLWPIVIGVTAAALFRLLGVRSILAVVTLALTVFVASTIGVDLVRATRARRAMGERALPALGGLLLRHNRRYGGFVVHLAILVVAVGVTGSQAWSVHTETTLKRGEQTELGGYRIRFDGLRESQESNHGKVTGIFTIVNGRAAGAVLEPAKKFYPQQSPIAYVDYRLGLVDDIYLVLGDFAGDGTSATVKFQVNRMVSWIWIGGLVLTLGTVLAVLPERRKAA